MAWANETFGGYADWDRANTVLVADHPEFNYSVYADYEWRISYDKLVDFRCYVRSAGSGYMNLENLFIPLPPLLTPNSPVLGIAEGVTVPVVFLSAWGRRWETDHFDPFSQAIVAYVDNAPQVVFRTLGDITNPGMITQIYMSGTWSLDSQS